MIIVRRQGLTNIGKAVHMEEMTDKQFDKILKMGITPAPAGKTCVQ